MRKPFTVKHVSTPSQISDIEALVMRSALWHWLAAEITKSLCLILRYRYDQLQTPRVWTHLYVEALAGTEEPKIREAFLQMKKLSRARTGIVLMLLYFTAQHARLQFHSEASADILPAKDGIPSRALDRHHRSVTRMLTRLLCAAVGCLNPSNYGKGWHVRVVRNALYSVLRSGNDKISTHAVMRWVSIGDKAAEVTGRRPDTLQKSHKSHGKIPLSSALFDRAKQTCQSAFFASPMQMAKSALLGIGYICIVYYIIHWLMMGIHFIRHLHA